LIKKEDKGSARPTSPQPPDNKSPPIMEIINLISSEDESGGDKVTSSENDKDGDNTPSHARKNRTKQTGRSASPVPATRARPQSDITIEEMSDSELSDTDSVWSDSNGSYEAPKRPSPRLRSLEKDFQSEESLSESDNGSLSEASTAPSSSSTSDNEPTAKKAQRKGTRTLDAHPELYKVDTYPSRNAVSTHEYTLFIEYCDSHPMIGTSE
jgi:hypothetical protein